MCLRRNPRGVGHVTIGDFSRRGIGLWRLALGAAAICVGRTRRPDAWSLVKHSASILRGSGFGALKDAVMSQLQYHQRATSQYDVWLAQHRLDDEAKRHLKTAVETCAYQPTISVIVPVYNPPAQMLRRCIESVKSQLYARWELCIADDPSTHPQLLQLLEQYASEDPRIKMVFRERNGHIAATSNSALGLATGEFLALLDHDDELSADALL